MLAVQELELKLAVTCSSNIPPVITLGLRVKEVSAVPVPLALTCRAAASFNNKLVPTRNGEAALGGKEIEIEAYDELLTVMRSDR